MMISWNLANSLCAHLSDEQRPPVEMLIYVCCIVGEFDDTASKASDLVASKSALIGHTAPGVT